MSAIKYEEEKKFKKREKKEKKMCHACVHDVFADPEPDADPITERLRSGRDLL
jgi:hypothetical protein